jgi:hypothetical protein
VISKGLLTLREASASSVFEPVYSYFGREGTDYADFPEVEALVENTVGATSHSHIHVLRNWKFHSGLLRSNGIQDQDHFHFDHP